MAFVMRAALPPRTTMTVPILGEVTASVEDRQIRSGEAANLALGCHGIVLSLSGASAVLWVDKGLARRVVDVLLGRQPSLGVGQELSRIERGLLLGTAAGMAAALGLPPTLRIGGVADRSVPGPVVVRARVEIAGGSGHGWLCSTEEFVKQVLSSGITAPELVIELSRTVVAGADVAAASVNDVVVFDETAAVAATDRWPVGLRVGDNWARADLLPDGKLVVESVLAQEKATHDERCPSAAERAPGGVELVAEIARFAGASLIELIAEPVLSRTMVVTLARADARWAEGNITAVDGCLAVRLTKRSVS
jgi:hypothetical protein